MSNASKRTELRRQQQQEAAAARRKRMMVVVGIVGLVAVLLVAGVVATALINRARSVNEPPSAHDDGIRPLAANVADKAPQVELLTDFQCGGCAQFENRYGKVMNDAARKGEINLIFRPMIFLDASHGTHVSQLATEAALCADQQGKYAEMNQALMDQAWSVMKTHSEQEQLSQKKLPMGPLYGDDVLRSDLPNKIGLTGEALTNFQTCVDEHSMAGYVEKLNEAGQKRFADLGKQVSTPTLVVNGKVLDLQGLPNDDPQALITRITEAA